MDLAKFKILIIEDTPEHELMIRSSIGSSPNFMYAKTILEAKSILTSTKFDLIILDLVLPDGSGYDILMDLKKSDGTLKTPTIITSGKGEVSDKVMGFNSGALDYIVKPFNPVEFRTRIENKLNFVTSIFSSPKLCEVGNLQIDTGSLKTIINQDEIDLSPLEFKLLKFFMGSVDQVFSRDQLLSRVWGENTYVLDRTVDSTIASIRKKTNDWDFKIKSIYGMGYQLNKKKKAA